MIFNNPYLETFEKISLLQRWIIVHSIIYYELNRNVVSDKMFDENCLQLVDMKVNYPMSYKKSEYYYCMKDFDGTTGFDLFGRLIFKDREYLTNIAQYVVRSYGIVNEKNRNSR